MKHSSLLAGAAFAALTSLAALPALAQNYDTGYGYNPSGERAETRQLNEDQVVQAQQDQGPYNGGYENSEYKNRQKYQAPMNTGYYGPPPPAYETDNGSSYDQFGQKTNNGDNGIGSANGEPPTYDGTNQRGTPNTYGP